MPLNELLPLGVTAVMLPELDLGEQLRLCRELGVTHYVYRPRIIQDEARGEPYHNQRNHKFDLTPQRLFEEGPTLRQQIEEAGLVPFGTVPRLHTGKSDQELELHLNGAAAAGASNVRLNPEPYPRELFDYAAYMDRVVERYREIVAAAARAGVKIVIETHTRNAATSPGLTYQLVQHFDPDEVGVIVDLLNYPHEGFVQPELAVSVLSDWIDHVHIGGGRRVQGEYEAHGFRRSRVIHCPVTESDLDIPRWLGMLAGLGRSLPLVIENYVPNMAGARRLHDTAEALSRLLEQLE